MERKIEARTDGWGLKSIWRSVSAAWRRVSGIGEALRSGAKEQWTRTAATGAYLACSREREKLAKRAKSGDWPSRQEAERFMARVSDCAELAEAMKDCAGEAAELRRGLWLTGRTLLDESMKGAGPKWIDWVDGLLSAWPEALEPFDEGPDVGGNLFATALLRSSEPLARTLAERGARCGTALSNGEFLSSALAFACSRDDDSEGWSGARRALFEVCAKAGVSESTLMRSGLPESKADAFGSWLEVVPGAKADWILTVGKLAAEAEVAEILDACPARAGVGAARL